MEKIIVKVGYCILIIGAISMLLPFLWMVCLSFMTDSQIFSYPPQFLPNPLTIENYNNVFLKLPLLRFFINSLFVAIITTFFQVLFSAMAGYIFARSCFKYKDILFFAFLLTMMVPPQVNIVPLFFVMRELGWVDTYQSLIVPGLFGGFGVFLMRQWFLGLSSEIEEAACIDGCNFFERFFKIALPLSVPALVTLALFTFITTWNSFLWPLIVTNSVDITTLPVAIAQFKGSFREVVLWGDLMACSVILALPVIAVFLLGKKYFINDILSGGIKE
ncbi:carbohydrate ABC transporter permease [bacterium]|nr:carbohydrate ABC transporter permease [bacterium]